jgi:UPF0755 protein
MFSRKFYYSIISLFVLLFFVLSIATWFYSHEINKKQVITNAINIELQKGEGVKTIAAALAKAGLVSSARYFELYVAVNKLENRLKAGNYTFSGQQNIISIADTLVRGDKNSGELRFTIPEGWNAKEIDKQLALLGKINPGEFVETVSDSRTIAAFSQKYGFLVDKPAASGLEGYLFPDTYRVFKKATAEEVADKMLQNFDGKLSSQMRDEIRRQGKSIYEVVTMASLLEKEVRKPDDMKLVAGIFWQRIKAGQPLQSCATLAYVLGVSKSQYSVADTKIDSAYNTYQHRGLPPGPIGNPGLIALQAAVYPIASDYNYFLTAPDGSTIYSKSFDEHVRNKNKYLK